MKVLIVDDEKDVSDFFAKLSRAQGYADVDTVASAQEAVAQVLRQTYDLITLDIRMPGASGLEIVAMLRNMCPHAIIAVMSGYLPESVSGEVASCVDVMVDKPVPIDTFNQLLAAAAQISGIVREVQLLGS